MVSSCIAAFSTSSSSCRNFSLARAISSSRRLFSASFPFSISLLIGLCLLIGRCDVAGVVARCCLHGSAARRCAACGAAGFNNDVFLVFATSSAETRAPSLPARAASIRSLRCRGGAGTTFTWKPLTARFCVGA
ncbi:hypothetical protein EJB05_35432, partial [Eragrostis curvula]